MTAAKVAWWNEPPGPIPHRFPLPPVAGRGPEMVAAPGQTPHPLITHAVHKGFCGFRTSIMHPLDDHLGQCAGCRCWMVVPPKVVAQ